MSSKNAFLREYAQHVLKLRQFPARDQIGLLTMLAEENKSLRRDIVLLLFQLVDQARPDHKLPMLYVIDSILKKVGGLYKAEFEYGIVDVFQRVFLALDASSRVKLHKLVRTWHDARSLSPAVLGQLDLMMQSAAHAPPAYRSSHPRVHHDPRGDPRGHHAVKRQRVDPRADPVGGMPAHYVERDRWGNAVPDPRYNSVPADYMNRGYGDPRYARGPENHSDHWHQDQRAPVIDPRNGALGSSHTSAPSNARTPAVAAPWSGQSTSARAAPASGTSTNTPRHFMDLTESGVAVAETLYGAIKQRCAVCGIRFPDTDELKSHMDWHFKQNNDEINGHSNGRGWFRTEDEWIDDAEGAEVPTAASFFADAEDAEESEAVVEHVKYDATVGNCPVCQDSFQKVWSDKTDSWCFENAQRINGRVVHATCAEAYKSRKTPSTPVSMSLDATSALLSAVRAVTASSNALSPPPPVPAMPM